MKVYGGIAGFAFYCFRVGLGFGAGVATATGKKIGIFMLLFLSVLSHGLLDAITNGGLGVAFLAPFDDHRFFFPWRPIQVSPIGLSAFFSSWGFRVILSELLWIGIPCAVIWMVSKFLNYKTTTNDH